MATAAARARKRDLGPDWRDALGASLKRFALRSWGILLLGVSIAGALSLATHNSTDPSFTTAAGGPPANWLGAVGAYASDALLLLFGLGSALLLPAVGLAGVPVARRGRGLVGPRIATAVRARVGAAVAGRRPGGLAHDAAGAVGAHRPRPA